jgi:hypothetical protein
MPRRPPLQSILRGHGAEVTSLMPGGQATSIGWAGSTCKAGTRGQATNISRCQVGSRPMLVGQELTMGGLGKWKGEGAQLINTE